MKQKTQTEQIIELAKSAKLLRVKDITSKGLSRSSFYNLVENGKLVRRGRGLYSLPKTDLSEHQMLLETAKLSPKSVICLLSALRFHELTTQNPFEVWIAIENKARIPEIETIPLRIFFYSGASYYEGIETYTIENITLKVYSPAKTVVDCFKYRNKIGLDVAIEALRETWRKRKATMDELWHYAKIGQMSNVMRPYMESLV